MAIHTEIRIYDTTGARQPLPDRYVQGWEFELVDRGGCGTFELTLAAELDDAEIPALPEGNWRVEWYFDGAPIYRGWVVQATGGIQDGGGPYKLMGTGRMARCESLLVDCAYARPGGEDIGEIFGWLADRFLVGDERLKEISDAIQRDTGYTVERAEFFGSTVREAFDRMAESAAGLILWGWDVTVGGNDRLYVKLRPTTTPDAHIFRVGGDVAYYQQPADLGELVNAIRLVGGSTKAPSMLFNPSFELPIVPGEDASGNLLFNSSFESDGDWLFNPSPESIRQPSGGEPGEYARTGRFLAELDGSGDSVAQSVTLPTLGPDHAYRLVIHHAKEFAGDDAVVKVHVEERSLGNTTLNVLVNEAQTDPNADDYGRITSTSRSYQAWEKPLKTTQDDTKKLYVKITRVAEETIIDDVYLFQDSAVQEGWTSRSAGNWKGKVHWTCNSVQPFHGSYCIQVDVTSGVMPGTDGRYFEITPTQERWLQAREQTEYTFKIRVRGAANLKLKLGMYRLKPTGGYSVVQTPEFSLAGTGGWETFSDTLVTGSATQIRPFIALRSRPGTYFLDAFEVYESGTEDRGDADFLDGETLTYYFRSDDVETLPDLSAAAQASIATYGLREAIVEVPEITELAQAKDYATGYFNRYAVPLLLGQLALEPAAQVLRFVGTDEDATPTGMLAIRGAGIELPDQYPARILYSLTKEGTVRCELDLTNRRPDRNLLLRKALGGKSSGGGGYGGGGANLRPGPGNSYNGGENGTAPTWRVDDTDIGTRSLLNLKGAGGIELTGTDDETDDEVEVEISLAAELDSNARVGVTVDSLGLPVLGRTVNVVAGAGISALAAAGSGDVVNLSLSADAASNGDVNELLGTWAHADISALTNATWLELNCGENPGTTMRAELSAGRAGTVTRMVVDLHGDVGGATVEFKCEIYKNGSPTGAMATIAGTGGSSDYYARWTGSLAVVETDRISVWGYRSGAVSARRLVARVYMV